MRPSPVIDAGARVALVAPAGPLRLPADLDRALANARTLGWEPVVGANAREKHSYFAGADEERLADLNAALRDDSIQAIWCLRGGYGWMGTWGPLPAGGWRGDAARPGRDARVVRSTHS